MYERLTKLYFLPKFLSLDRQTSSVFDIVVIFEMGSNIAQVAASENAEAQIWSFLTVFGTTRRQMRTKRRQSWIGVILSASVCVSSASVCVVARAKRGATGSCKAETS